MIGQDAEVPQVVRIEEGVLLREALELSFQEPGCIEEEQRLVKSDRGVHSHLHSPDMYTVH